MRLLAACLALGCAAACARPGGPGEVTPQRWAETVRSLTAEFDRIEAGPARERCEGALNELEANEEVVLRAPTPALQREAPFLVEAMREYYGLCADGSAFAASERYRRAYRVVEDYVATAAAEGHPIR